MMKNNIEQLIYGQLKTNRKDEGFITLEVIVALIVGLVFFAVSLQAFGVAVAMKAQSQERQRANELIQEDIERISQWGNTPLDPITPINSSDPVPVCNPVDTVAAAPIPARTAYQNSYAGALWTALTRNTPNNSEDLRKTVSNKVRTTAGTGAGETVGSIQSGGRTLALERFNVSGGTSNDGVNGNSNNPHRTLKVGYQVWYWREDPANPGTGDYLNRAGTVRTATDNAIAETYVEVIPDVALSCP